MDRFELRRATNPHASSPTFDAVEIHINGAPLLETVRALEEPQVVAELASLPPDERDADDFLIAGKYMYPTVRCFEKSPGFFGRIESCFVLTPADADFGKVVVMDCDCGNDGCWPFLARIEWEDTVVRWSDFGQFHRDWTYDLGPFSFSRVQYEAELERFAKPAG